MEERNVNITLDKAIEWYNSNDTSLREIALRAFNENELMLTKYIKLAELLLLCLS